MAMIAAGLALSAALIPGPGEVAGLRASLAAAFLSVAVFSLLSSYHEKRVEKTCEDDGRDAPAGTCVDPRRSGTEGAARTKARGTSPRESPGVSDRQEQAGDMSLRLEKLTEAHRDLLAHHRLTKMMLRSSRVDEVYEIFLRGVREGLGFSGAVIGVLGSDGMLSFQGAVDSAGGLTVRIHGGDGRSILARTFWKGDRSLVRSMDLEIHVPEDRQVIGDGPALLFPILPKTGLAGSEFRECRAAGCPDDGRGGERCWIARERLSPQRAAGGRQECVSCALFAPRALLVVRAAPGSRDVLPETLGSVVSLAGEASLALEVVSLYEEAKRMSVTDGLTGLVNYREFYQCVRRELERAKRYRRTISLLMIDLDDFKKFNDSFGHLAGDKALQKVADLLRRNARASDIVARYGGEEFGVIMPESTPSGALMLAERIKTEIANTDFMPQVPGGVHITVSVGIYSNEDGQISEDQFVNFADEAAYLAKNSGKNRVVVKSHA